jgi:hypothetical protein
MARLNDYIRDTPEYQQITAAKQRQQAADETGTDAPAEVPAQVAPVVSLEKGDLEFWMQVAAVVLLFLIYREMARANGAAAARGIAPGGSG